MMGISVNDQCLFCRSQCRNIDIFVMHTLSPVGTDRQHRTAVEDRCPIAARTCLEAVYELDTLIVDDPVVDMVMTDDDMLGRSEIADDLKYTVIEVIRADTFILHAERILIAGIPAVRPP